MSRRTQHRSVTSAHVSLGYARERRIRDTSTSSLVNGNDAILARTQRGGDPRPVAAPETANNTEQEINDPPPPYEAVATTPIPSRSSPREPPRTATQQYLGECNRKPRQQGVYRVAAMPLGRPTPYRWYLDIVDRRPPPVKPCVCRECQHERREAAGSRIASSLHQRLKKRLDTCVGRALKGLAYGPLVWLGSWGDKMLDDDGRYTYRDAENVAHTITIRPGIAGDEVERTVRGGGWDWTADWDWALSVRLWIPGSSGRVEGVFYFNDLPTCLREGVRWEDGARTREHVAGGTPGRERGRRGLWRHSWAFSEDARYPRWCGRVSMSGNSGDLWAQGPWGCFTTGTCER